MQNSDSQRPKKVYQLRKKIEDGNQQLPIQQSTKSKIKPQQSNTVLEKNGSSQDNYDSGINFNQDASSFDGPKIEISKIHLSFKSKINQICTDYVTINNCGSTAIYYQWIKKQKVSQEIFNDTDQRFYCLCTKNVINPGEKIDFFFSFISKNSGIFNEQYIFQFEPRANIECPVLTLTGNAFIEDSLIDLRQSVLKNLSQLKDQQKIKEVVDDMMDGVKTPDPPLPDLENPEVRKQEFESLNPGLWYSEHTYNFFKHLEQLLYKELQLDPEQQYWNLDIKYIHDLIQKVKNEEYHLFLQRQYSQFYEIATQRPLVRSELFGQFKDFVNKLCDDVQNQAQQVREQEGLWEQTFEEPSENAEEQAKRTEENNKKIQEWIKKSKKKWTDVEQKAVKDNIIKTTSAKAQVQFDQGIQEIDKNQEFQQILNKLEDQNNNQIDNLNKLCFDLQRKNLLSEQDIEGRRIMIKVNLKLGDEPDSLEKKQQHEQKIIQMLQEAKLQEEQKLQQQKDDKKQKKQVVKKGKKEEESQVIEQKEIGFDLSFLNQQNIQTIVENVKFCLDRSAKLVILLISYDKPTNQGNQLASIKFFFDFLKTKIEQNSIFVPNTVIPDFQEKLDNDFYPDNSLIVLENLQYNQCETGYKIDEDNKQKSLSLDEKSSFIELMNQYSYIYVLENDHELYQNHLTSMKYVKGESCNVFGLYLGNTINILSHMILLQKNPEIYIIGGQFCSNKLLLIDLLAQKGKLVLLGEIGLLFSLIKNQKTQLYSRKTLGQLEIYIINQLIEKYADNLILPKDFQVYKSDLIPFSEDWNEEIVKIQKQETYEEEQPTCLLMNQTIEELSDKVENKTIIGFGNETISDVLELTQESQKIVWFDQLSIHKSKVKILRQTDKRIAEYLFEYQKEKKEQIKEPNHDFKNDKIIFLIGNDLQKQINGCDFVELSQTINQTNVEDQEDNEEAEQENQENLDETKQKMEIDYFDQIKDFALQDTSLAIKLLCGEQSVGAKQVYMYDEIKQQFSDEEDD